MRTGGHGSRSNRWLGFGRLPLFWKLLVPFVALLVVVGSFGAFVIVRVLSSGAQSTLNEQLAQRTLDVRGNLQERELYLLEAANLAASVQGMGDAVVAGDGARIVELLGSVLALKTDLTLVVVTDAAGTGVVEYAGASAAAEPPTSGTSWSGHGSVGAVLAGDGQRKQAGFIDVDGRPELAVVAPICPSGEGCVPTGAAIVALDLERVVGSTLDDAQRSLGGVAVFDPAGQPLVRVGLAATEAASVGDAAELVRRREVVDSAEVHTAYAPLEIAGERRGTLAVSLATAPVFASVRDTGVLLGLVLLASLVGIVAIGAWLSRSILRQVGVVVETNRSLGAGDLSARAPVIAEDEIGEIARGLNAMAQQLQASHETLESRVGQRTREVERLLRERTQFFASLSHELRTPIAVILSGVDLILALDDPDAADAGRMMKQSAGQLLTTVNDILDLAKAEAGRMEVNLVPTDLGEVVDDLRPTIDGLARSGDLMVTVDVPPDLPHVLADPMRVREIVLNLVDNAAKYTPSGGEVAVRTTHVEDAVEVVVSDTGPGIPPEVGDRIFEPFFRVEGIAPERGRAASGLGLALTRGLVEAHGGRIVYVSEVGVGSTFTVALPIADEGAATSDEENRNGDPVPVGGGDA